jgi:antitoxin PrlF
MSAFIHEEISTLTARYQTTVPAGVRRQLKLKKGDQIRYQIDADGRVYLEAARDDEADPALGPFLDLLSKDIQERPEALQDVDIDLIERLQDLVKGVEVDLDAPLTPEDD